MNKERITKLDAHYDVCVRCWVLDAYFDDDSIEEIFAWAKGKEIPPMPQLSSDLVGLTLQEARAALVEKYGADPWPTMVSFADGMAHFEDGTSVEATPEMLRAVHDLLAVLIEIVDEAKFYETYQLDENYELGPTTSIGRARAAIAKAKGDNCVEDQTAR
jgi:hypothetical protein